MNNIWLCRIFRKGRSLECTSKKEQILKTFECFDFKWPEFFKFIFSNIYYRILKKLKSASSHSYTLISVLILISLATDIL